MKKIFMSLPLNLLALALICCAAIVGQSQTREKFVISARAGGVNSVSGQVTFQHRGAKEWQLLTAKDDLDSGDLVKTGKDGLVEVLLNPGTYLRLPENSEFELADASLDGLKVRLSKGSAIVEAAGVDGGEMLIRFDTPQTTIAIVRRGIYRINVMPSGQTEVVVRNGRALVGNEELKVKGGNKVLVGGGVPVELAKYDKKNQDQFDLWSKERAETLAKANEKLSERALNGFFSSYSQNDWANLFDASQAGIWFFNPRSGCYTFLPFSQGWGSPYGHSYMTSIYYFPRFNNPYYNGQPGTPISNGTGGGSTGGNGGPIRTTPTPMPSSGSDNPIRQNPGGHKVSPNDMP
ncbi:MAG TPA: FecR family protein [Pyrinomonadaceae bacterium]|jgi:hypothetical protein|nr:FecR family protein [Pyrinomonadaceae bacterium]